MILYLRFYSELGKIIYKVAGRNRGYGVEYLPKKHLGKVVGFKEVTTTKGIWANVRLLAESITWPKLFLISY